MNTLRCDAIVIQIIATELDEHGRPVNELTGQPSKVFRAATPDIWAAVDRTLGEMAKQRAEPPSPVPPAIVKGKRR